MTIRGALANLDEVILVYFVLINSFYALLLCSAALELRGHLRRTWAFGRGQLMSSSLAPRVSVLAPAHNEEATIVASVRALLTLNYPGLEVIVVNDGSADHTLDQLQRTFELEPVPRVFQVIVPTAEIRGVYRSRVSPSLVVVDKVNGGGKADALNAGLNISTGELVCAIDADTIIEPDALQRMVPVFLEERDVIAVGGTIRVINDSVVSHGRVVEARAPRRLLPGVQAVEYLRAFLFGRVGWNRLGGNLIISGAFGVFDRSAMARSGGYVHDTVGEDAELVARLRRRSYELGTPGQVRFIPDPVAWTEVPESLRVLGGQRDRWHRGLADVLSRHRRIIFNPRYGALGLVVAPYFFFVELLGPVIEAVGIVSLVVALAVGALDAQFAMVFFLAAYGYGLVLSAATLTFEELSYRRFPRVRDTCLLAVWTLVESLGYRQLTVVWRLRGLWRYFRKSTAWGAMTRSGFGTSEPVGGD